MLIAVGWLHFYDQSKELQGFLRAGFCKVMQTSCPLFRSGETKERIYASETFRRTLVRPEGSLVSGGGRKI